MVFILLRILPPSLHIDAHEDRHCEPDHKHKEEKGITDVARHVGNEADYQRTDERTRL